MPGRTSKRQMSFARKWTVGHGVELDRLLGKQSDAISSLQQEPDVPLPVILGEDGADAGDGPTPALEDHVHALPYGAVEKIGPANVLGSTDGVSLQGHTHALDGYPTTKGDLWTHDGATAVRVPVPADVGFVVASDPSDAAGWAWRGGPAWFFFDLGHQDFQAAAMAFDFELLELAPGAVVHAVKIKHGVQFAGTGITDYKVSVGVAGNLVKYAPAFDVDTVAAGANLQISGIIGCENQDVSASLRVAATSTGANLDQSTVGEVGVWVLLSVAA